MELNGIIGEYDIFLDNVFENIKSAGFELFEFSELDHICYRVESFDAYETKKKELKHVGKLISEELIANRPISIYELKTPIISNNFEIGCIELPAPKENNRFAEGLEHAEFVISTTLKDFIAKHADIDFDLGSYDKEINPEIVIKFKNCSVKFHESNIKEVIDLQKSFRH